jgi:hypothetical protein
MEKQEQLQDLSEEQLQAITGGGIGNLRKPLLTPAEKASAKAYDDAAAAEKLPKLHGEQYHPPIFYMDSGKVHVLSSGWLRK